MNFFTFGFGQEEIWIPQAQTQRIMIDSRDHVIVKNRAEKQFEQGISIGQKERYTDAVEVLDNEFFKPLLDDIKIAAFV